MRKSSRAKISGRSPDAIWTLEDSVESLKRIWDLDDDDIRMTGPRVEWMQQQVDWIIDHFDLDVDRETITCAVVPQGFKKDWSERAACIVAHGSAYNRLDPFAQRPILDYDGSLIAMSDMMIDRHGEVAAHLSIRHEIAHLLDYMDRGFSIEGSDEFREKLEEVNAPSSVHSAESMVQDQGDEMKQTISSLDERLLY